METTKLVLGPHKYIVGEANICRFISRIFPNDLYESSVNVDQVDQLLDSFTISEGKHPNTKLLTASLEGKGFLAGPNFTLADIMGLSAVKTFNIETPQIKEWKVRCKKIGYHL